ncbi:hypothetical protein AC1031_004331 [Aphanomyces cochlioides]|nr:hypothetical protein AC1031_004331 [Aphanomyces cochlioides]
MALCIFNDCPFPAQGRSTKCAAHRNRSKCEAPHCPNQAYARGRCVRHGAKRKCAYDQCQLNRRFGSYCSKHADVTQKKQCIVQGCDKQPHARGKCVKHGGGRRCKVAGCMCHARLGVYCTRHFNVNAATNMPLGPPPTVPDSLDWAILQDLIQEYFDEVDAKRNVLPLGILA